MQCGSLLLSKHQNSSIVHINGHSHAGDKLTLFAHQVPVSKILNTGNFDMEKASAAAGWLQSLKAARPSPGEAVEFGITSFVYRCVTSSQPQLSLCTTFLAHSLAYELASCQRKHRFAQHANFMGLPQCKHGTQHIIPSSLPNAVTKLAQTQVSHAACIENSLHHYLHTCVASGIACRIMLPHAL